VRYHKIIDQQTQYKKKVGDAMMSNVGREKRFGREHSNTVHAFAHYGLCAGECGAVILYKKRPDLSSGLCINPSWDFISMPVR
jgi:hypothetical protein